jgi:cytochrome c-type biogenesis protein CcmH/NrfG
MRAVSAARQVPDDELFRAAGTKSGGAGRWIGLFLLVAGIGLAGGYYLQVWQPQQEALAKQREEDAARKRAEDEKRAEEEKAKKEAEAKALAEAAKDAGPLVVDAGAVAVAAVVDAGTPAMPDAGAVAAVAPDAGVKAPVKRDYEGWMILGDRLRASDRAEAAMNAYGEAADMKPDRAEPIAGRGLALLDMGKYLQAEASFDQALKLNPHYGPALMGMAEQYRYTNKTDKAIEYYQKYLDVLPDGPESNVAKTQLDRLKKGQ